MKAMRSGTMLALVTTGILLVASPAFAWVCTAKNERGAAYTAVGIVKAVVSDRAIARCRSDSAAPNSCYIVNCAP